MDFCNECGSKTDPEWVFCRACGSSLDASDVEAVAAQPIATGNSPKVELISRGWDVVDIEPAGEEAAPPLPIDPMETDEVVLPLDPDAVEISVDDVTVVARPAETEEPEADEEATSDPVGDTAVARDASDRWDHLRPHGVIPGISDPSRVPAKVSQMAVLSTALAALVSAVLYLFLNIQLDRFAAGNVSGGAVRDVRTVAEGSLLVVAGLGIVSLITFVWWTIKARPHHPLQFGLAGWIALPAWLGGAALVGFSALLEKATVADELTANSLIVIGLGLLMLAGLATIRSISRIVIRDRW